MVAVAEHSHADSHSFHEDVDRVLPERPGLVREVGGAQPAAARIASPCSRVTPSSASKNAMSRTSSLPSGMWLTRKVQDWISFGPVESANFKVLVANEELPSLPM